MKPRTSTILAVVLAVIGVALYVTGTVMSHRVDDALQRVQAASDARDPFTGLDEAASIQLRTELEDIESTLDRASLLRTTGLLAFLVAVLTVTHAAFAALAKRVLASLSGTTNDR